MVLLSNRNYYYMHSTVQCYLHMHDYLVTAFVQSLPLSHRVYLFGNFSLSRSSTSPNHYPLGFIYPARANLWVDLMDPPT